jgi:hypothetical protein
MEMAPNALTPNGPRTPIPGEAEQAAEKLRQEQDDYLDEALEETFPASDPIAPGRPHESPVTKPLHHQGAHR